MATTSRIHVALISAANILIIIFAVIIMCLSLGYWSDYATCVFTIVIALCWSCCICVESNVAMSCYSILMITDMLFLLASALYHTVFYALYQDYCVNLDDNKPQPEFGCSDWRHGHMQRSLGVFICYYVVFLFRLLSIVGSCLLAKALYQEEY